MSFQGIVDDESCAADAELEGCHDDIETLSRSDEKTAPTPKKVAAKFKKAPQAPKRFKSAFIFFSTEKHREIRLQLGDKGVSEKTTNVAKLVSEAWRELSLEDREKWEIMARKDKTRYEVEKSMYRGPWKVPANKRTPKDPTAPKRPMSAFLAFSNSRRSTIKRQQPDASNADISRALAAMWRDAPSDIRQTYIDQEFAKRQEYKAAMVAWRKKFDEEKRSARQQREEMALRTAEAIKQSENSKNTDAEAYYHASYTDRDSYYRAIPQPMPYSGFDSETYGSLSANPHYTSYGAIENSNVPCFAMPPFEWQSGSQLREVKYHETRGGDQQPLTSLLTPYSSSTGSSTPIVSNTMNPFVSTVAYPYLHESSDGNAFEMNSEARSPLQHHTQGQYPFSGYWYPSGWDYRTGY